MGEEIFNQLLAELALHERVGGDLTDVAGATAVGVGGAGQLEESLGEGDRECVLAGAGVVQLTVELVQPLVLDSDVGRVADDDVEASRLENGRELLDVLGE